jgi:hypothetical protein
MARVKEVHLPPLFFPKEASGIGTSLSIIKVIFSPVCEVND